MPYDNPEPDDPMALTGVAFETTPATALEAAYTFAEELARLGQSEASILHLFQSPQYRGPYSAFQVLGMDMVVEVVNECCRVMASCRTALQHYHAASGQAQVGLSGSNYTGQPTSAVNLPRERQQTPLG